MEQLGGLDRQRAGGAEQVPDNTRGSVDINANEAAHYYQVTLSSPGTITLDMNPQIDSLSIAGAQSQLVIGAPYTLEVLLGTVLSAGTLTMLPGGTLTTGIYTQTGGLLQFQLTPGGAGRITVANTATLGGTLGVAVTPGLYGLSTQYTLLTAGTISGQFAQFISSPPRSSFLSLSGPFYDATSVDVTVTRTPFGAVPGLTRNQRAVGNALEGAYSTTLTGPAATIYTNLLMTGTPDALSQLSGEGITATQNTAFASGTMFDALLMDQGAFWRSGEAADSNGVTFRDAPLVSKGPKIPPPVYQPRTWRVWTGGFGGVQSLTATPQSAALMPAPRLPAERWASIIRSIRPGWLVLRWEAARRIFSAGSDDQRRCCRRAYGRLWGGHLGRALRGWPGEL